MKLITNHYKFETIFFLNTDYLNNKNIYKHWYSTILFKNIIRSSIFCFFVSLLRSVGTNNTYILKMS